MRSPSEVEERLAHTRKALTDAIEFQATVRLNYGWDLDRERVLGRVVEVENEKRKLLEWVLGQDVVGDK